MTKSFDQHRKDIVEIGRRIYQLGYVAAFDGNISVEEDSNSIIERKNISSNGIMEVTILLTPKGNIHDKPFINFRGLPINEREEFIYGLEDQIDKTARTFSLNNKKQEFNIIEAIKTICRKYTKEKTGKRPVTNINLIRM